MLKNKLKVIALLVAIILSITVPVVRAENEVATDNAQVTSINDNSEANNQQANAENTSTSETQNVQTSSEDTFKKSDIYLYGDNITVDYIVDGNLFICANSVTINSQIGGDAFIIANNITIEENGYIFSNLFAISQNIDIKGIVYDVYALSQNTNISGYIYRDIKLTCSDLSILGVIGRNAFVNCSNITFSQEATSENIEHISTSQGSISGNLNYSSSNVISIPEGAVSGETNYTKIAADDNSFNLQDKLISLGTAIATTVIIWLLCLWLTPKFLTNASQLVSKKILPIIGFGILTPIVIIMASIILFVLGITSTIGLLALGLLFIILGISTSIFVITLNNLICNKLKIEKTIGIFGMLIVDSIILWLIKLIPYVGSIVGFVAVIIGLGIIISNLFIKNTSTKSKKTNKKTENLD